MKTILIIKKTKGITLILTILIMALILLLAMYILNSALTESRIAKSQAWSAKTYYLAEAGMQNMIWKLKNDATYKTNFETDPDWTASFSRTNPFGANSGSYSVSLVNSSLAHGEITASSSIDIGGGKYSKRIIKTYVYRAIGQSGIGSSVGYADGNINISSSNVNYIGGNAHSNGEFVINGSSNVNIDGDLEAVGNYNKNNSATVAVSGATYAKNFPPAAANLTMPAVDFNSSSSTSFKNIANVTYTAKQFEDLIKANPTLTLNGIIYVSSKTNIKDDVNLTINGLLVVNGDFEIASDKHTGHNHDDHKNCDYGEYDKHGHYKCKHDKHYDVINITVNSATSTPSGIMANGNLKFRNDLGNIYINGVVYATNELTIDKTLIGQDFIINGGTASRKLTITNSTRYIDIVFNNQILHDTLSPTSFSPIIMVEHWEEEY